MLRPWVIPRPTSPAFCSWRYHQRWTACGLGALLRVRADGEHLLTFRPAAVVDLLRRVEQEVIGLRRPTDVGEIGAEKEPELGEHRAAKGEDPFLATRAVHAECAAVSVGVAYLDTGQLASADTVRLAGDLRSGAFISSSCLP